MFNLNFSAKIREAEEHVKQGEKYMKTSFLKWKPDLDSAIDEFDKACTCYRVAEKYDQCRDLSIRVAELQIQKGTPFFAAKSYEQAAQMTQQLQDLPTAAKYYDRAGQLYVEGGYRDSGAILYERCALQFQQMDRAITIDFYLKSARLAEQEDKAYQAADLYEKAAMQAIRMSNFPKTSELLEEVTEILTKIERFDRINRVILYRVLLKLFNEDSVAGRNIFNQACQNYPTFDNWEERDHIGSLLDAFDLDDKDLISQRCQKPFFMAIEPEFVRLMKRWIRPTTDTQSSNNAAQQRTTNSTAPSTSSGTKPIQLDDDDDLR
ncbi:unnamed protein product [Rotaria magnacalcarata]|uniref:Gamma-soluble NSF attachment protein n=4 Tax=Rotaria magnacalcarata TaxID=392030 RepID=A0A819XMW5_9BILA|nr:unnamed protein product [Rotaria magnacalcarata]CAF1429493.1 unnamed protein product [Rotaria magnacalcarata]CAF2156180.1 unnamed protein product [Rotaria magnacalcarata]CAF2238561.1 unnamed protein product [Rotaria magnacalcarata]CAF4143159.1 unnamed protein product [Rotaria magnacalcarata]